MLFYVTYKKFEPILLQEKRFNINNIYSSCLREDLVLLLISGNFKDFESIIIKEKIIGRFLLPLLSQEIFCDMFGTGIITKMKLKPTLSKESLLEELIAHERGFYANRNTYYFSVGDVAVHKDYSITNIIEANSRLEVYELAIPANKIKKSLKDILIKSIESTIKKELSLKFNSLDEIEKYNEDFFLNGLAEFLLNAYNYYPEKEIKEFLMDEFGEDLTEIERGNN